MATKASLPTQKKHVQKRVRAQQTKDQRAIDAEAKRMIAQIRNEAKQLKAKVKTEYAKRKPQLAKARTAAELKKKHAQAFIRKHPLASAAGAMAAGYLVGRMLKKQRRR